MDKHSLSEVDFADDTRNKKSGERMSPEALSRRKSFQRLTYASPAVISLLFSENVLAFSPVIPSPPPGNFP